MIRSSAIQIPVLIYADAGSLEPGDAELLAAAKKATFSADKLRRRRAEGTINYTFK